MTARYISDNDEVTIKLCEGHILGVFSNWGDVMVFTSTMDFQSQSMEVREAIIKSMIAVLEKDLEYQKQNELVGKND